MSAGRILCVLLAAAAASRPAAAATFGTVVTVTGGATDIVLDEPRQRLYIVNSTQNRVDVYSTPQRRFVSSIATGQLPLTAAMSRDGKYLYVTAYTASTLEVIDLDAGAVARRVILPAAPEGVAVGADGRVLITTIGAGQNNSEWRLALLDPNAADSLRQVFVTLPPPAPAQVPAAPTQVFNTSRSRLAATPDGRIIIGLNNPSTTSRQVFVYETASASVLRSRTVTSISSVLSVAPDGSKFMAGLSLFDTETLAIVAQQNSANSLYPFPNNTNFNTQQNQGGSVFAPDGSLLYSAFNITPVQNPAARANSSQLMLSDPDNLLIHLGLQLAENLTGKIVISSDGADAYALSQSGFLHLPVGAIYNSPIVEVDSPAAVVANDQCGVTAASAKTQVTIRNQGQGRMTVSAQVLQTGPTFSFPIGGEAGGAGGGAPGGQIPIILPGGGQGQIPPGTGPGGTAPGQGTLAPTPTQQTAVSGAAPLVTTRQTGSGAVVEFTFNPTLARSLGTGTPTDFLIQSPEAINIPPRIRVYQNNRNAEANATVLAAPVSVSTAEGLTDIVLDAARQRLYIANSGLNRVEVFDMRTNEFAAPIKVGQLPRSLALDPNGGRLYVANTGGESITIIDLERGEATGKVRFPPVPYNASFALNTPSVIAATLSGLQIVMSNGALWKVVDNVALPRAAGGVLGTSTVAAPRSMIATPGGEYALLLGGTGIAYLYDALSDEFVLSQQVATVPIQGYYGALAAGPGGQYFVVNGTVLNRSLTPVGQAVSTTARPIYAVAAVSGSTFARFVQPARTSTTAAVTETPAVEIADSATGSPRGQSIPAVEGPLATQTGTQRVNVSARTMAVDPSGSTAYLLTSSGLSIVPLTAAGAQNRPQVSQNGVVDPASRLTAVAAGSLVSIYGQNLAAEAKAANGALPAMLGGVCVTLDNTPLPLLMTSPGQINALLPASTAVGRRSLVVRAIDRKTAGNAYAVTVSKYAPAAYVNPETGMAAVYRPNGQAVSKSAKAKRDEPLYLLASGLGPVTGNPPATGKVQVFFGDPRYKEAEVIVDASGPAPGLTGLYRIDLRVPGAHIKGDALPVTIRVGGVESPTTGTAVPVIAVD